MPTAGRPRNPDRPRLEPFALAALLTALVLGWCPLTAIAAVVLGGIALHRIVRSGGARTGRGLAFAGMGIALGILFLELSVAGKLLEEVQESMDAQAVAAIESSITPLPESAPAWDPSVGAPSAESIAGFARTVTARVGAVTAVAITRRTAEGVSVPVISTAFNASCERGTVFGNATFGVVPATLPPTLVLRSIEVEVGGERLALPTAAATPADGPADGQADGVQP